MPHSRAALQIHWRRATTTRTGSRSFAALPGWITATSYPEAVAALSGERLDVAWLNHDIGGNENRADAAF